MKIRFCTLVRSHSGYAEFGRILVDQCLRAGHDVGVAEIPMQVRPGYFGPLAVQAMALLDRVPDPDVNIVTMIPPRFEKSRVPGARNIGCTMFETDRLPAEWLGQCNAMDAIWVPSEWVREMFVASGVRVPVSVVGVEAVAAAYLPPPAQGPFRMLSVFEWSERKNPLGLLRAWCTAFDGDADVALTLKVSKFRDPARTVAFVQSQLRRALEDIKPRHACPRIDIVPHALSGEQVRELHQRCHGYISLSRGEGWGLPPWDATLAGRPVIHTAWSAPLEFLHAQGQVGYELVPVQGMDDFVRFYDDSMNWADAQLDDAVAKLRSLRADYASWSATALRHREEVLARYSEQARASQLQAALAA